MIRRRKCRVTAAAAVVALVAASCGTRLDHDDIVGAAGSMGTSTGQDALDPGAPGSDGVPGDSAEAGPSVDGVPGGSAEAGQSGMSGTAAGSEGGRKSASGGPGKAANGEPIVIGSAGTSSGLGSAGTTQTGQALRAWAAVTNAKGGIDGRPVKVIVMDDGGDAAKARSQVQELVEKHKVVALVSNFGWTASVNAWRDYVEKKRVPAIGGNCFAEVWESSPVFFSQCPALNTTLYGAVHLVAKHGRGKKFGALVCSEDAACSAADERWFEQGYAKKAGLEPSYHAKISLSQPDFTSECIQARNAGVEILALAVDPATTKRIVSSCRRQNFNPQYLPAGGAEAADTPKFVEDAISPQMVFPFAGLSTPAYQEFSTAWRKYRQDQPAFYATTSWASAKIFEKAARSAKDVTRSGLIDALYKFKNQRFGGLTVPLSYGPKGTDNTDCIFYMKGSAGKWSAPQGDRPSCW